MRIQHNIMAMNAYRNYTNNVSAMKKNLERLSSGYKINRAGDDAAGLAISEKMRAQITGLETAQKNAKDGISLVQTAEGALTEVHDMLNRMVELASMSANGTYDNTTDRAQLQKEIDQLQAEINRIADSSNFNGINLLDGSMDSTGKITLSGMKDVATATGTADAALGFKTVTDGQLVTKAPAAGVYSIDFKDLELTNSSTADIQVTFELTGNKNATFTVKAGTKMSGEDVAAAIAEALRTANGTVDYVASNGITVSSGTGANAGSSYHVYASGSKVYLEMLDIPSSDKKIQNDVFTAKFGNNVDGNDSSNVGSTHVGSNAGNQFEVTPEVEPVSAASRVFGQATFALTNKAVQDGNALKIGDTTYIFAVGKDSKYTQAAGDGVVIVDLTDQILAANTTFLSSTQLITAAQRLAKAAESNSNFYVGSTVGSLTISLTEKEGGVDYTVNNLAGADGKATMNGSTAKGDSKLTDWAGLVTLGKATMTTKGSSLTLQIGDTAQSYNQLKVNISDCHTTSIGIDGVDISTQVGAAAAIDTIKAAINYVSDVRGTLGATQNRLEHTINNLSVMTENIQDAESTIRDTDVAAEMMAYTKNNILIQSAQAMLAQANQIPQGVLQLLQ